MEEITPDFSKAWFLNWVPQKRHFELTEFRVFFGEFLKAKPKGYEIECVLFDW